MLRLFSSLCLALLTFVAAYETASANILLTAIPNPASGGPVANVPGLNLNNLAPGQEFQIQITARAIVAPIPDPDSPGDTIPQTFAGADFTILAGGGGTFQLAVANNQHTVAPTWRLLVDDPTKNASGAQLGFGGWFHLPPQGGNTRQFSGGPNSTASFSNTTTTRTLGYIVLRAGNAPGTYNVNFGDIAAVNGDGLIIAGSQGTGFSYTVRGPTEVDDTFAYHRSWTGVGSSVDSRVQLHREGGGLTTLSFDNLLNSSHGINGIGIDLARLPNSAVLTLQDFDFQMSPQGAFSEVLNPPQSWPAAPSPASLMVTTLSQENELKRASFEWQNRQIENRWLRITVKANGNTGLVQPHVYYVGHLRGETTGPSGTLYAVSLATDVLPIRAAIASIVESNSTLDIDKNGVVQFVDIIAMRNNVGTMLTNITVP